MDEKQAQDSIKAIEQMWGCDLMADTVAWKEAFAPLDSVTVAAALLKLFDRSPERPSIDEVVAAVKTTQAERESSPHVRTEKPEPAMDQERGAFLREVSPWTKGWAVARYKYQDHRAFPEQRVGYDSIQISNPRYRTYVWPDQELMPPEDAAKYIAEGENLGVNEIFRMMTT